MRPAPSWAQALRDQVTVPGTYAHRMQLLGALAGGIAHDFNNLLTIIGAAASALAATDERTSRVDHLSAIQDAVDRATALTRELLVFAHGGSAPAGVSDLREVVSSLERLLRRMVGGEIELRVQLGEGPMLIDAHRTQVEQVLMNLVSNARDASPRGAAITVGASRTAGGTGVSLVVEDEGTGIPSDVRARMFEPLFTTKGARGTGLGLAVVAEIAARLGATLSVESAPRAGSRFEIAFPASRARPTPPPPYGELAPVQHRVLLVEPDPMVRQALGESLVLAGIECVSVATVEDAEECLEGGGPFDAVVCDESAPPPGDWGAPADRLVVLTASAIGDAPHRLAKPCAPETLVAAIDALPTGRS